MPDIILSKRYQSLTILNLPCIGTGTNISVLQFKENVLFDEINEKTRIIVFFSKSALENVANVQHYFADGTFRYCAKPFYQLYEVHGDLGSTKNATNIIPFFYAFLNNNEEATYEILFSRISHYVPDWKPTKFTLDFEKGPINALKKIFPQSDVKGCFVHFSRALLRKAKGLGLLEHEESHNHVKMCMGLAHLPRKDISDGWLHIMSHSFDDESIKTFNDYFVNQWLDNEDMIDIWCCYDERHRTTNLMESWNSIFNRKIGRKPSLLLCLQNIIEDLKYYEEKQKRFYNSGDSISKRKQKYVQNDCILEDLRDAYKNKNISLEDYLLRVSKVTYVSI